MNCSAQWGYIWDLHSVFRKNGLLNNFFTNHFGFRHNLAVATGHWSWNFWRNLTVILCHGLITNCSHMISWSNEASGMGSKYLLLDQKIWFIMVARLPGWMLKEIQAVWKMRLRNHPTPICDKEKQGEMKWYIQEKDQLITEKVKKIVLYQEGCGVGGDYTANNNITNFCLSLEVKNCGRIFW